MSIKLQHMLVAERLRADGDDRSLLSIAKNLSMEYPDMKADDLMAQLNVEPTSLGEKPSEKKQEHPDPKPAPPQKPQKPQPKAETSDVRRFRVKGIDALLSALEEKAAQYSFPRLKIRSSSGFWVQVHVAGSKSKRPGDLTVTNGLRGDDSRFYGYITPSGVWETRLEDELLQKVRRGLVELVRKQQEHAA